MSDAAWAREQVLRRRAEGTVNNSDREEADALLSELERAEGDAEDLVARLVEALVERNNARARVAYLEALRGIEDGPLRGDPMWAVRVARETLRLSSRVVAKEGSDWEFAPASDSDDAVKK